jgi:hypothetical protein
VFEKLTRGIYALNAAGAGDIHLSKTKFLDNIYGAYFSGYTSVAFLQILSNTFRNGPPYPNNGYGLYLDQCTGFHVEDNKFYQEHSELKGIGLVVNNAGTVPNEIYRNRFHHLKFATLSQNENRNYSQPLDLGGLCYKCNKFVKDNLTEPNWFDFAITYDQSYTNRIGIAHHQGTYLGGSNFAPVGNMLSPNPISTHYDFYNEGNGIDYYYHLLNQTGFRLYPDTNNIYGIVRLRPLNEIFYETSCPSTISNGSSSEDFDILVEASNQSDSIAEALTSLIDGGSTDLLTFEVVTSTPPEAVQIRDELLNESPYLSDTVMKISVNKEDVLNNAMIRDVLVANPQSAKSEEIMGMLENRTVPMSDYMMEQILAGEDMLSAKEILEARKAWWDGELTKSYTRLLNHYKGDSLVPANEDSLNWLFDYRATLSSQYDKAGWLHSMGEFPQAEDVLNAIPASFNLNATQFSTNDAYHDFYDLSEAIYSDTTSVFRIDSTTAFSLQVISDANNGLPGIYARNILLAKGEITYREPIILPDTGLKQAKRTKFRGVKDSRKTQMISVFPNPAQDYFVVRIDRLENPISEVIKLYDGKGKMLQSYLFSGNQDQIVIPTNNFNTGVYLIVLDLDDKHQEIVKIAIIK